MLWCKPKLCCLAGLDRLIGAKTKIDQENKMFEIIFGIIENAWFYIWSSFLLTIVVWFFFINAMLLKGKEEEIKEKSLVGYYVLAFFYLCGYGLDIFLNYYVGSVLHYIADRLSGFGHSGSTFLPDVDYSSVNVKTTHKLTFTARLKYIKTTRKENTATYKFANFVCKKMLIPFDPDHCSVGEVLKVL